MYCSHSFHSRLLDSRASIGGDTFVFVSKPVILGQKKNILDTTCTIRLVPKCKFADTHVGHGSLGER